MSVKALMMRDVNSSGGKIMARLKCGRNGQSGNREQEVLSTTQAKAIALARTKLPLLTAGVYLDLITHIGASRCPLTCPDRKIQNTVTDQIKIGTRGAPPIESGGKKLFRATARVNWTVVITCKGRRPEN